MNLATDVTPDQAQTIIYTTAISSGIPDPLAKLIVAQSGHETNGWTSNVWLNNNNGFGYGYTGTGYKMDGSIEESVGDIVGWISRRQAEGNFPADLTTITDADTYATLLRNSGYYTDTESNYAAGIVRWFNNNLQVVGIGIVGILGIGIAAYFLFKK
jgi:Mannosyl-glycoprotein endo-beta-N-acetylglucosaminidase